MLELTQHRIICLQITAGQLENFLLACKGLPLHPGQTFGKRRPGTGLQQGGK